MGRRGQGVPRLHGWLGRRQPGTRAPRGDRGGPAPGGDADPDVEPVLHRAAARARGGADRELRAGQGLLLQQRRGGQRRRGEARQEVRPHAPRRRARDHHDAQLLPRPHARDGGGDRPAGVPGAVEAAHARLRERAVRRPRGREAGDDRGDRRGDGGARPGRGRRERADRGLPQGPARVVRRQRSAAHLRRDPDRHGPPRHALRPPVVRRRAGRDDARQGARERGPGRRVPVQGLLRRARARGPRQHLRRQRAGDGRGQRDGALHDRERRAGARQAGGRLHALGARIVHGRAPADGGRRAGHGSFAGPPVR